MCILERSSKLISSRSEVQDEGRVGASPDGISPPECNGNETGASGGWKRTARIRTPKAYAEVKGALERIEVDLPVDRRTNWALWDGKVQPWHFATAQRRDMVTSIVSVFHVNLWRTSQIHLHASPTLPPVVTRCCVISSDSVGWCKQGDQVASSHPTANHSG
jgi:hypothetical protein